MYEYILSNVPETWVQSMYTHVLSGVFVISFIEELEMDLLMKIIKTSFFSTEN